MSKRDVARLEKLRERLAFLEGLTVSERNGWAHDCAGWQRWEQGRSEAAAALAELDGLLSGPAEGGAA
jgi:hypothetical protein